MGGRSQGDSQNPEKKAQHGAKVLQVANSERVWHNTVISNICTAKICLLVTQTTLIMKNPFDRPKNLLESHE